jgi:hypothetical protein
MVGQIAWERLKQAGIPFASTNAIVTKLIKGCRLRQARWALGFY